MAALRATIVDHEEKRSGVTDKLAKLKSKQTDVSFFSVGLTTLFFKLPGC